MEKVSDDLRGSLGSPHICQKGRASGDMMLTGGGLLDLCVYYVLR